MASETRANALVRSLTIVVALLACTRALLAFDPMPGWGLDPYAIAAPAGAFGPREAAIMDVLTLLLSGIVLLMAPPSRWKLWVGWAVVLLLIAVGGLAHGLPDGPRTADLSPALAWLAALAGAGAIVRGCAHAGTRRAVLALLAGFTAMFVAKGLVQLLVEHPATVAQFEANKARMLAAQGLEAGSSGARAFERRLRQPEITGWIGFSNVVASFLAAGGVALAAIALGRRKAVSAVAGGGAFVAFCLVLYGGSKGAMTAGVLGLACVALGRFVPPAWREGRRRTRVAGVLAGVVILGPLLALVARGMVGERVGELSLLFRWFYIEASSRIVLESPIVGVGPGGFKDAYALAKNPISPENAASPHSVVFDALATMGVVVGAATLAILVIAAWRSARVVLDKDGPACEPAPFPRLALIACPAFAVAIGARFELQSVGGLTTALVLAWLGGLVGWVVLAWAVWRGTTRGLALGVAAAGLVLIAHGQIEMTPVLMGSAALWAAWLAVACARAEPAESALALAARMVGAVPALLALVVALLALPGLWVWQGAITRSAIYARQPAEFRWQLESSGGDPRVFRAIAEELSAALNRPVSTATLVEGLGELARQSSLAAANEMSRAVEAAPADGPTLRAASRAWLVVALSGDSQAAERSVMLARQATESEPISGQNYSQLATVLAALDLDGTNTEEILESLARAEALNPASPQLKYRQFQIARDADLNEWAERSAWGALEADTRMRLDPLGAGLSDQQRDEIGAYLEGR